MRFQKVTMINNPDMKKIRLALYDDDAFVRDAMQIVFEDKDHIEIIGSFSNADNLLEDLKTIKPDLVLMDIEMPGINGIEAVKLIREHNHEMPVLMLTQFDEEDKVIKSITAGANGYLLKTTPGNDIIARIEELFSKESKIDPEAAKKLLELFSESFAMRTSEASNLLTHEEKHVLTLLEKGENYKKIADEMKLTQVAVKSHIKKIYEKLNVDSVSGAVAIALSQNLINGK
jgi:DNA-binding NarL/FixJ family response regulator